MNEDDIAKKIKNLRKENKFTQKKLSEKLGVTQSAISYWETGIHLPDIYIFLKLLDLFNISFDDFFELNNHQSQTPIEFQKIQLKKRIDTLKKSETLEKLDFAIDLLITYEQKKEESLD